MTAMNLSAAGITPAVLSLTDTAMIEQVWIEGVDLPGFDPIQDSTTVTVRTEGGKLWAAEFVTLPYLARQMTVSRDVAMDVSSAAAPTRFAAVESPHVIVDNLTQDTIEDAIDNMMTLGVFESVFAPQLEFAPQVEQAEAQATVRTP